MYQDIEAAVNRRLLLEGTDGEVYDDIMNEVYLILQKNRQEIYNDS